MFASPGLRRLAGVSLHGGFRLAREQEFASKFLDVQRLGSPTMSLPLHFGQTKQVQRPVTEVSNKCHLLMEGQQGRLQRSVCAGALIVSVCRPPQSPLLSGIKASPQTPGQTSLQSQRPGRGCVGSRESSGRIIMTGLGQERPTAQQAGSVRKEGGADA